MATLDTVADRSTGSQIAGKAYFETSTNKFIVWNGESWIELHSDGVGSIDPYNIDIVNTEANILARTGDPDGTIARVTDSSKLYVYQGGAWYVFNAEPFNQYSLSFNGSSHYLAASSIATPTAQQGTLSAWFKTGGGGYMPIFTVSSNQSGHSDYWLVLQVDLEGKVEVGFRNGGTVPVYESSSVVTDNEWHHVMVTSNGSAWKIFLDGSEDTLASGTNTGDWIGDLTFKDSMSVGANRRSADTNNTYFTGSVDDVALWDYDQSSNYSAIWNNGTPGDLSTLDQKPDAWWRMGDDANDTFVAGGSVASITDSSGNGYTATQAAASSQPTFSTSVPA